VLRPAASQRLEDQEVESALKAIVWMFRHS
jgi:hypothetical protein